MARFLIKANYVADGVKGLLKEGGSARREAVRKAAESVGGRLESFYYAFGECDVYVIMEVPDNVNAAAVSLVVNASGEVRTTTTVLLTPEEMDAAVKKTPQYRAPGK